MPPEEDETVSKAVHLKRLASKQEAIDALKAQLATAQEQLANQPDPAKAAKRFERVEKERDQARAELEKERAERGTEKALLTAGITDPEDMSLVRYKFEQSGSEDFAKYLSGAAKEDRHLSALFASPEAPAPPPATPDAPAPAPKVNPGTVPAPPLQAAHTPEWLRNRPPEWWHTEPKAFEIAAQINGVAPPKSRRS